MFCFDCKEDEWHADATCEQYAEFKRRRDDTGYLPPPPPSANSVSPPPERILRWASKDDGTAVVKHRVEHDSDIASLLTIKDMYKQWISDLKNDKASSFNVQEKNNENAKIDMSRAEANTEAWLNTAEGSFSTWAKAHSKLCPTCHAPIEKNGGCNAIKCQNCKSEFWSVALFCLRRDHPIRCGLCVYTCCVWF